MPAREKSIHTGVQPELLIVSRLFTSIRAFELFGYFEQLYCCMFTRSQ
jgi:hypothetical protein